MVRFGEEGNRSAPVEDNRASEQGVSRSLPSWLRAFAVPQGELPPQGTAAHDALLDSLPYGLTVLDARLPHWPVIYLNRSFCQTTGFAPEDCLGKSWRFVHGIAADNDVFEAIQKSLEDSVGFSGRVLDSRKDGTTWWNQLTLTPIRDQSGQVILYTGTHLDVSETAQLEEEQRALVERAAYRHQILTSKQEMVRNITNISFSEPATRSQLKTLLNRLRKSLSAESATILMLSDDKKHFVPTVTDGLVEEAKEQAGVSIADGVLGRATTALKPVLIDDLSSRQMGNLFMKQQIRGVIGAPLVINKKAVGMLQVGSIHQGHFSREHLDLLAGVADRVAVTIDRSRLLRHINTVEKELHALSGRLLDMLENERRYIASELHDEIGQALTAVKLSLQALLSRTRSEEVHLHLSRCMGVVEDAMGQVRQMSIDLRPPVLDMLGLVAALREYSGRVSVHAGFDVQIAADELTRRLPNDVETACFRVAQEALTNVARHAQASKVEITLRERSGALHLTVCDDGQGFDIEAARARTQRGESLGLLSMEERVLLARGTFKLYSRPGSGTQLRASFTLE